MTCERYIDSPTKNQIVGARQAGQKIKDIAAKYNVGIGTVSRICQRMDRDGNVSRRPKSGRPRKTTRRQDLSIVRHVQQDPNRTATDASSYASETLGVQISSKTAGRRLKDGGLFARRPARKPLTKKKNRLARLEFARSHKDWTKEDFRRVLWSDETKVNLFNPDGGHLIRRPVGKRYTQRYVRSTVKFGGGSIMVWGKTLCVGLH